MKKEGEGHQQGHQDRDGSTRSGRPAAQPNGGQVRSAASAPVSLPRERGADWRRALGCGTGGALPRIFYRAWVEYTPELRPPWNRNKSGRLS